MRTSEGPPERGAGFPARERIAAQAAYKRFARQNLGPGGLCLTGQSEIGFPGTEAVPGPNWRDNVNYVRSFGYQDE